MTTTIETLLTLMATHGGKIISTKNATKIEIAQAKASGRIYEDESGNEFMWEPYILEFPDTDEGVELFEKWYPIDTDPPEGFFEEMWRRITEALAKP